ncbi:MAG: hypothetical protein KJI72_00735 [Patescibacteria group bacterium]|nr:hypothetical protein [Patescibacteria group bacterium]
MKKIITISIAVLILGLAAFFIFFYPQGEQAQVDLSQIPPTPAVTTSPEPIIPSQEEPIPQIPETEEETEISLPVPSPPPAPPREPQEFIVTIYSNERAEPANPTIRVGDTVTFINADNELHWPGADPHPTHSSLPPFDALGGISKGQSFSYTFRKTGSFGYHEHLLDDPPTLGVVTVLP